MHIDLNMYVYHGVRVVAHQSVQTVVATVIKHFNYHTNTNALLIQKNIFKCFIHFVSFGQGVSSYGRKCQDGGRNTKTGLWGEF